MPTGGKKAVDVGEEIIPLWVELRCLNCLVNPISPNEVANIIMKVAISSSKIATKPNIPVPVFSFVCFY
jgi:hypothetical protein